MESAGRVSRLAGTRSPVQRGENHATTVTSHHSLEMTKSQ